MSFQSRSAVMSDKHATRAIVAVLAWLSLWGTSACKNVSDSSHLDHTEVTAIGDSAAFLLQSDSSSSLVNVRDVLMMREDLFVVANGISPWLVFFDTARSVWASGGVGEGPGEFRAIEWVELLGSDTLVAYDPALRRLSKWTSDGRYVGLVSLAAIPGASRPVVLGLFDDGTYLVKSTQLPADANSEGYTKVEALHWRVPEIGAGEPLLLGRFEDGTIFRLTERTSEIVQSRLVMPRPFASKARVVPVHSGHAVVSERGLEVYDSTGSLESTVRFPWLRRAVTDSDREAYIGEQLTGARSESDEQRILSRLRHLSFPDSLPLFDEVHVASDGAVWISEHHAARQAEVWHVFTGSSQDFQRIATPAHLRVLRIADDYIAGIIRDPDTDEESVVILPLW